VSYPHAKSIRYCGWITSVLEEIAQIAQERLAVDPPEIAIYSDDLDKMYNLDFQPRIAAYAALIAAGFSADDLS